ncbi:hypothetical protein OHS70_32450 [Streptomyces sp. NBC_00390]
MAAMPSYAAYRTATAREIPLVLVTAASRRAVDTDDHADGPNPKRC